MSPFQFLKEVKEELDRVHWPQRDEVVADTLAVILFTGSVALYFWIIDMVLTRILEAILM